MPWTAKDAQRHTEKANTPQLQAIWAAVANKILKQTNDEGEAIRLANAAVSKDLAGAHDGSGGPKPEEGRDKSKSTSTTSSTKKGNSN